MSVQAGPDIGEVHPALVRVVPAELGRRVAARLADALVLGAIAGVLVLVAVLGPDGSDTASQQVVGIGVTTASVLVAAGLLTGFAATGWTPGGYLLGVRQVRVGSGDPPGVAGVGKCLLAWLLIVLTLGIGYVLVGIRSDRDRFGRSWLDRVCGLISADVRLGRDPRYESAGSPSQSPAVPLAEALEEWLGTAHILHPAPAPAVPGRARNILAAEPDPGVLATQANPRIGRDLSPVTVRLPDGRAVPVAGPTAFGRDPEQPPGRHPADLVEVPDPDRAVSKTHAILTPQPGGVLVEDLDSTNGTTIITDQGQRLDVRPGVRLTARLGWQVALAGVRLKVEGQ